MSVRIFGITIFKSQEEREIQTLFDQYEKTLSEQKNKMFDDITAWGDGLRHKIHQCVVEQKYLLEQDYASQVSYLNKKCRQFIEELHMHEGTKNTEEIQRLLDKCDAFQSELATLEYHGQNIPFIQLIKEGKPLALKRNENDTIVTGNNQFDNTSITEDDDKPKTTFTNDKHLHTQLSTMNSASDYSRSTNNDDNQKFYDTKDDDLHEKCPVCFMIFPPTMLTRDRSQHVHEHYTDN